MGRQTLDVVLWPFQGLQSQAELKPEARVHHTLLTDHVPSAFLSVKSESLNLELKETLGYMLLFSSMWPQQQEKQMGQ